MVIPKLVPGDTEMLGGSGRPWEEAPCVLGCHMEDGMQQIPTSQRDPGDGNAAGNYLGMSFFCPSAALGRMELGVPSLGRAAQQWPRA